MTDENHATTNDKDTGLNTSTAPAGGDGKMGKVMISVIALVYTVVSGYLLVDMRGRISKLEQKQVSIQQKSEQRSTALESNLKSTADALASQVGTTQEELAKKTAALRESQHAAVSRLSDEQKRAIGEVNAEVSGVKSDVDATKTDVAITKTDLQATKARLESTIGDLGVQSGLVAHNRDELEMLKHKSERDYFDFTLVRGKPPTRVSTVSLQLRKVDPKKNRFTLNVLSDDKTVEKRDRNTEEPLQFYTGKDHRLYELVVFSVSKNQVTGYLSTPKQETQSVSQLMGAH